MSLIRNGKLQILLKIISGFISKLASVLENVFILLVNQGMFPVLLTTPRIRVLSGKHLYRCTQLHAIVYNIFFFFVDQQIYVHVIIYCVHVICYRDLTSQSEGLVKRSPRGCSLCLVPSAVSAPLTNSVNHEQQQRA